MTRDEITDLLEELIKAYPYYLKNVTDPDGIIDTWEREFGEYDAGTIFKAARHHINTSRYFPAISDIRGCINKGQMIYGQDRQPAIEAPQKLIAGEMSEESPCRLEHCILYHDLCNGLDENGECPFEGL